MCVQELNFKYIYDFINDIKLERKETSIKEQINCGNLKLNTKTLLAVLKRLPLYQRLVSMMTPAT